MVLTLAQWQAVDPQLSVLALSSRFDGLCCSLSVPGDARLSVLALSSRFDGPGHRYLVASHQRTFSTRSVESF